MIKMTVRDQHNIELELHHAQVIPDQIDIAARIDDGGFMGYAAPQDRAILLISRDLEAIEFHE